MHTITAPYNFIPLNKEVFYPDWSDTISHDIPFKDGESGEISIQVIAKSPIFIRNHYEEGDEFYLTKEKEKISKEFCHIKVDGGKHYYISATSIKGMIRNLVEIMSFGEICIDKERWTKPLSVRDMTNKKLVATAQKCGFLVEQDDGYIIQDCGNVLTISYNEIEKATKKNLKNIESAKDKYNAIKNRKINFKVTKKEIVVREKPMLKNIALYESSSSKSGELIFTNKIKNKKNEFVFYLNGESMKVDNIVVKNFKKVYFQDDTSELGKFWKGEKRIPVFYTTDDKTGKINAIGLTQVFKLIYNKTILEAAKQKNEEGKLDLAQGIFGYMNKKSALKGRVMFSHCKSNIVRYENVQEVEQVLGSPNPTYYPNYIEQLRQQKSDKLKVSQYTTLMDEDAIIRGYKQYPLQNKIQSYPLPKNENGEINHDVTTMFKPLESGTTFEGKIRFHNLKKAEIGALLSALSFHGQGKQYLHNLGMAKPLGYGKVEIEIRELQGLIYTQQDYLNSFKELMDSWETEEYNKWNESRQIKELFAIHNNSKAVSLKYQGLENDNSPYIIKNKKEKNEFIGVKKEKEFLLNYTKMLFVLKKKPYEIEKIYAKYKNDILQIYAALKDNQINYSKFTKKELAKYLLAEMKKNDKLVNSNKKKDIQRFEWLKEYIKG